MISEVLQTLSPAWMRKALCGDADPDLFYPEPGEDNTPKVQEAKRICARCPVRINCLLWAFQTEDRWAVLGGKTANQRIRIAHRVQRRRATA